MTTTAEFRFYQNPFLVIASALAIGVYIGYEVNFLTISTAFFGLFCCAVGILFMYSFRPYRKRLFFLSSFLLTLLIGVLLMQNAKGDWQERSFADTYQKGDLLVLTICEIGDSQKEWVKMTANVQRVYKNSAAYSLHTPIVLFLNAHSLQVKAGDVLMISSDVERIRNNKNPGEFDAELFWNRKGFWWMSFASSKQVRLLERGETMWFTKKTNELRTYLRESLEKNLSGRELAIALALILGDKSLLDSEITTSFINTGAMHVLAVSGLHVGIIMQILMAFFTRFSKWISRRTAVLLVLVIVWVYSSVTGLSPSILRAVFMFSVLVLSELTSRNHSSINSLFFTGFVVLCWNPFTLYDIGFQLSFLAMLGIFCFYRRIELLIYVKNKLLRKIWQGTAIGFAAQLMTAPLSLYYFHQFPNYFILTNIGLMASSGLILGIGIFIFSIRWFIPIARFAGIILSVVVFLSLWLIEYIEHLPGAVAYGFELPFSVVIAITALIFYLFFRANTKLKKWIAYTVGIVLLISIVYKRFENHQTNEICFFNGRKMLVIIRKGEHIFCFYKGKAAHLAKLKFAVNSYAKIHPGSTSYYNVNEKKWHITSGKLAISSSLKKNGNVGITVNGRAFTILFSNKKYTEAPHETTLAMPWVVQSATHYLKNHAFVVPLSQ